VSEKRQQATGRKAVGVVYGVHSLVSCLTCVFLCVLLFCNQGLESCRLMNYLNPLSDDKCKFLKLVVQAFEFELLVPVLD
jgi:hypothetical protein